MYSRFSFTVVLSLLTMLLLISGCQVTRYKEDSFARVQASGRIVVGVDPSYPPFAVLDEHGQPGGFEIDLVNELSGRLGVSASLVAIDVGSIVDALIARKIDVIIAGLSPYPEYTKQLAYSRPYFNAGQVLIVPHGGPVTLDGLAGKVVAVEGGSTGDVETRQLVARIGFQVKSYTTPQSALDDLRAGRADAAVTDVVTARETLRQMTDLTIAGVPFTEEYYVVAARHADRSLLAAIDRNLADMDREGYLRALEEKWLR